MIGERFHRAARNERDRLRARRERILEEAAALAQEIERLEPFARCAETDDPDKLKGRAIREVAVPLLARDRADAPIHYREWLALLEAAGHRVAGKRPDAVFLGQVLRHPAVRSTTAAGIYQLDPGAVDELAQTDTEMGSAAA